MTPLKMKKKMKNLIYHSGIQTWLPITIIATWSYTLVMWNAGTPPYSMTLWPHYEIIHYHVLPTGCFVDTLYIYSGRIDFAL